jgi:hypothetical protein
MRPLQQTILHSGLSNTKAPGTSLKKRSKNNLIISGQNIPSSLRNSKNTPMHQIKIYKNDLNNEVSYPV